MTERPHDCARFREDLAAWIDGDVSPEAAHHLASCDECRDLRHEARLAARAVRRAADDYVPTDPDALAARVLAALDARGPAVTSAVSVAESTARAPVVTPVVAVVEPPATVASAVTSPDGSRHASYSSASPAGVSRDETPVATAGSPNGEATETPPNVTPNVPAKATVQALPARRGGRGATVLMLLGAAAAAAGVVMVRAKESTTAPSEPTVVTLSLIHI